MVQANVLRIVKASKFTSLKYHLKMERLTCIGHDDNPIRLLFMNAMPKSRHIRRIVVIATIRFLDDHGQRLSFPAYKTFHEDALGAFRNGDNALLFQFL